MRIKWRGESNNKFVVNYNSKKINIFLLRIAMGWFFFYAGITKVLDPNWSAAGYLKGAKTFVSFYSWLGQPSILPIVDFLNQWGLLLLGLALIIGLFVRPAALLGVLLMLLYYLPSLHFSFAGEHALLVDEHIIYILVLILLGATRAGRIWGLDKFMPKIIKK